MKNLKDMTLKEAAAFYEFSKRFRRAPQNDMELDSEITIRSCFVDTYLDPTPANKERLFNLQSNQLVMMGVIAK